LKAQNSGAGEFPAHGFYQGCATPHMLGPRR
jgi:hypothetical protein